MSTWQFVGATKPHGQVTKQFSTWDQYVVLDTTPARNIGRRFTMMRAVLRTTQVWLFGVFLMGISVTAYPQVAPTEGNTAGSPSSEDKRIDQAKCWPRIQAFFQPPAEYSSSFGNYKSLLQFETGQPVQSKEQWVLRRRELLEYWTKQMGAWPDVIENPKVEVLETSNQDGIIRKRVRIEIAPQQTGDAWLLVPSSPRPLPAVLVVYYEPETSIGSVPDKPYRDYGIQLAKRGFVTLNIGTPGGDARKPELGVATCQPLSFHAYVAANCYQILANMPEVDPKRIGVVGHSYGGKWSLFAGALWDKFAAVAVSDPGIVFDEARPSVNYWEPWYLGRSKGTTQRKPGLITSENPRTGAYEQLVQEGRDLHEVQALIAPRPFFVSGGSEDPPRRWQPLNRVQEVYLLLGAPQRIGMTNRPDHSPDAESNAVLLDFFSHFLQDSYAKSGS